MTPSPTPENRQDASPARNTAYGLASLYWFLVLLYLAAFVAMAILTAIGWATREKQDIGYISSAEFGTTLFLLGSFAILYTWRLLSQINSLTADRPIPPGEFAIACISAFTLLAVSVYMFFDAAIKRDLDPQLGQQVACDKTFLNQIFSAFVFLAFLGGIAELYFHLRLHLPRWFTDSED